MIHYLGNSKSDGPWSLQYLRQILHVELRGESAVNQLGVKWAFSVELSEPSKGGGRKPENGSKNP